MADLDNAKKYYDRSLKLNKNYAEAMNNLGTIHYARKSYRRAVSSYKKALQAEPQFRLHSLQSGHRLLCPQGLQACR